MTPGIAVDTLEGSLSVPAGCTLTLRKSGVVSPDGFATNGLMAHFDANQGVTYHTDFTDTRAVREWADVSGNGWKCVPLVDTEANAPLRVADSQGRKYMRLYWNKQNGLRFMKNGQFAEMTGIRIAEGDTLAWKQDAKADSLPKYNFGLFGCWVADDDNVLTYVSEDDYSPELVEEQKRTQTMHAAEAQLKQLKL